MTMIALIRNGVVVNVIDADIGFANSLGFDAVVPSNTAAVGDRYDGHSFTRPPPEQLPEPPPAPVVPVKRRLTKLQFIGRMTPAEAKALLAATASNPDAMLFIRMLDWATVDPDGTAIDLDDPRTQAGVKALFNAERAAQILE